MNRKSDIDFIDDNEFAGSISYCYPLSKISWLKVGGPADIFFRPRSLKDLSKFLSKVPEKVKVMPIGACSNLLVRDGGLTGIVVKLGRDFTEIKVLGNKVKLGAGNLGSKVAINLSELGFDLSFLRTIPGTIGGALAMNAGCYGKYIGDYVHSVEGIDKSGKFIELKNKDLQFQYRSSKLPQDYIVTSVIVQPCRDDTRVIKDKMREALVKREETQPTKKATCGSTFKNPDGKSSLMQKESVELKAWYLIDKAGLRGKMLGSRSLRNLKSALIGR